MTFRPQKKSFVFHLYVAAFFGLLLGPPVATVQAAGESAILSSLRRSQSKDSADQKALIQNLKKSYRETTGASRSLMALGLGAAYAREAPATALQYLSLARTGLAVRQEFSPALSYYTALSKTLLGYQSESVQIIRRELASGYARDGWSRALHSVLLVNLAKLKRNSEFLATYENFVSRFPATKGYQRFAAQFARTLDQRPMPQAFPLALEALSLSYPYSPEASWAFQRLLSLKCDADPKANAFAPDRDLLISLGRNASLDEGVRDLVAILLEGPVREKHRAPRKLDAVELVEALNRAKLGEQALALATDQLERARLSRDQGLEQRILPLMGRIYYNQQDYLSADQMFSIMRDKFPGALDGTKIRELLAENYAKLGSYRLAADEYRVLADRHPSNPQYSWQHFWSLYRSGQFKEAKAELAQRANGGSVDREGGADVDFWGAKIVSKNDPKEALAAYQRLLDQRGDSFYGILASLELPHASSAAVGSPVNSEPKPQKIRPAPFDLKAPVDELKLVELFLEAQMTEAARYQMAGISWDGQDEESSGVLGRFAFSVGNFRAGLSAANRLPRDLGDRPRSYDGLMAEKSKKPVWRLLYPMAYAPVVEEFERQAGVDKFFVLSIMRTESHYNPEAQSAVGAQGLMQIMPSTAVRIARLLGDSTFNLPDLKEPRVSIAYGAYYLQKLLKYYGGNYGVAAAAYNAGPIAVNNWIEACRGCDLAEFVESIPYRETRRYVKSVIKNLVTYKAIYGGTPFNATDLAMPAQLPEGEALF
ncbi:MAG: lytic transglycosylase domain-containing protein [Proteobacteria bacterium]|nr:lytic transglycosylase domain-containing protein [Pseudomonadota bacterium]